MEFILHLTLHSLKHASLDTLRILPFLFVTYFLMELLEHATGNKVTRLLSRSGKIGPLAAGFLGALPQCGMSSASAGLYSGRVITLGTLFAVFLSTSDEMLPVMLSNKAPVKTIVVLILTKIIIGVAVGFITDLIIRRKSTLSVKKICQDENCKCDESILRSSLYHTLKVALFVLIISFALELVIGAIGHDVLTGLFVKSKALSNVIAATVGVIPNCAASVILTELYLSGVISAGSLISGLLTGAGVGTLVLFKTNKSLRENLLILLSLWAIGALCGIVLDLIGFGGIL